MIRSVVLRFVSSFAPALLAASLLVSWSACSAFRSPLGESRITRPIGLWQPGERATRLVEVDSASAFRAEVTAQRGEGYELMDFAYGARGRYVGLFGQGAPPSILHLDVSHDVLRREIDARDGLIDVERHGRDYDRRFAALWIDSDVVPFRGRDEVFFDLSREVLEERMVRDLLVDVDLVCPAKDKYGDRGEVRYAGVVREGAAGLVPGVELVTAPDLDGFLAALGARPGLRPSDVERCAFGSEPTYAALLVPVRPPLTAPLESWFVESTIDGLRVADDRLSRGFRPTVKDISRGLESRRDQAELPGIGPAIGQEPPLTLVDLGILVVTVFDDTQQNQTTTSTGSHGPDPDPQPDPGTE